VWKEVRRAYLSTKRMSFDTIGALSTPKYPGVHFLMRFYFSMLEATQSNLNILYQWHKFTLRPIPEKVIIM
jgi:hypothetical protein